jgi:hypothetical protein
LSKTQTHWLSFEYNKISSKYFLLFRYCRMNYLIFVSLDEHKLLFPIFALCHQRFL